MKTLAIIGTGIAGLGTAYFLKDRFDLTLYEKNDYAGGHTHTLTVEEGGEPVRIDSGFMVYNEVTYPLLTRFFAELGVETKPTEMSFSVQHRGSGLEYNGGSLNLLFGQRRNLLRPRHWRMLAQIDRFNKEAAAALEDPQFARDTVSAYIARRGYGEDMLNFYLIPMSAAVWSTPPDRMLAFPAMTLLRFWKNHGFLGLHTQHPWRTVCGGARQYVEKLRKTLGDRLKLACGAVRVTRRAEGIEVATAQGEPRIFDKVVLACHADQSLQLLSDPTDMERRLLSPFKYQSNKVLLHTDSSVMPRTRRCWASWNYRIATDGSPSIHYWMNSLQGVSKKNDYFISLNHPEPIAPEKILRRLDYEHPLFDQAAIDAQQELPGLNRIDKNQTTYYAGAWFKYGFHEDGLASALQCARAVAGEELWS